MNFWYSLMSLIVGMIIGGFLGFYFTQKKIKKEINDNPPINEKMVRAMYLQMGRKPSEAQIRQTMNAVRKNK